MATSFPLTTGFPAVPARRDAGAVVRAGREKGAWHYDCRPRSRAFLLIAALVSAGFHAVLLFGLGRPVRKAAPPREVSKIQLQLFLPQLKDLEEPETVANDEGPKADLGQPVPMQADIPAPALPTDFVQQFDFASLVEQPDLSAMKLLTIPEHIRRPGKLMEGVKIFDLAMLDRIPEAMVQTPPIYPVALKREGLTATVKVEFLVDAEGQVRNAYVVSSDHSGFNESAIVGVSRWKFRAGMKGGRKVVTRMLVPIVFRVTDSLD